MSGRAISIDYCPLKTLKVCSCAMRVVFLETTHEDGSRSRRAAPRFVEVGVEVREFRYWVHLFRYAANCGVRFQ